MNKKIHLLLVLFLLPGIFVYAQQAFKMNASLRNELKKPGERTLDILIQGNIQEISDYVKDNGGKVKYAYGNIASITLPFSKINDLSLQSSVRRIELGRKGLRPLDDSSLRKNDIVKIHTGAAPLPQAYKGTGVIIGVIDTGIDPTHPDFKDTSGKTRILYLWDQNAGASPSSPQPYNYGVEWNNAQIDSGLCTFVDGSSAVGHGTKVTGVAAGNGNSAPQYTGIAPEADIISVGIDFANPGPVITDAMNYIFSKATALGKPCVINISLGDYYGSHDALDLESQLVESMTANIPGRAVVAAAGNSGDVPIHLAYTASADTNFTWFTNTTNQIYLQFYSDTANFKNISYTIGVSDTSFNYKNNVGFNTIDSTFGIPVTDTLNYNGNRYGIVETYGSMSSPGTYLLEVLITPDSLSYLWSFETTGSGKFDCWSPDLKYSGLPSPSLYPRMIYYKRSDTLQTMCTGFQCSNEVIAVGNGVARSGFSDVNNTYQVFPGTNDSIWKTSSLGPTRDGRVKPDIVSTGENIVTTGSAPWLSWLITNFPFVVTDDSLHMIFGGTSAASPAVAGFVALYLEKNPTATNQMIKQDIINCAKQDAFTGPVPNNLWGNGKLDGFNALLCSVSTVSAGKEIVNEGSYTVYPNPAAAALNIAVSGAAPAISVINMYDAQGKLISSRKGSANSIETIRLDELPEGLYVICLTNVKGDVRQFKVIRQN